MENKVFGRLSVKERSGNDRKSKEATWLCVCECGKEVIVRGRDLRTGSTSSCGCLQRETLKRIAQTHGMSRTRFYRTWAEMIKRCTNQTFKQYEDYGGRGINVDKRWSEFEAFKDDMYETYLKHKELHGARNTTLDRIDNEGDYTKDNCRWATHVSQSRNRRVRKGSKSGYSGVTFRAKNNKWIAQIGLNGRNKYLGVFEDVDEAIKARKEAEEKYWT